MDPDAVDAVGAVPHGSAEDTDLLDFSANTNPCTPDGVAAVYRDALADARTYDDDYAAFRAAAADAVDCAPERVLPVAGGLRAIRLAVATGVRPGETVLLPAPSFGEYAREVRLQGGEPVFVDAAAIADADPAGHAMVVVCNPNNPTGCAYDRATLESLAGRCRAAGTTLLVDEAFLGFTDRPSLAGHDGVVVVRSLTKLFGLPGLRAGYAVATGRRRERLETARQPWALGTPAAAVGAHCLRQRGFVERTRERVRRERARMRERLATRFRVSDSTAPFLLLAVDDADAVLSAAERAGVALRDARTFRGLDRHVRVAVRTPAENDRLLAVLGVDD